MSRRPVARVLLPAFGAAAALCPSALHLIWWPHVDISPLLLADIVVSFAATGIVIGAHRSRRKIVALVPWVACGALIGAGLIGPLPIAPYILAAATTYMVIAVMRGPGVQSLLTRASGALAATIAVYGLAARILGLTDEECADPSSSVSQRLRDADRARSMYEPGEYGFVYHFEHEAVLEIQTCAAQALYVFTLEQVDGGYELYWECMRNRSAG